MTVALEHRPPARAIVCPLTAEATFSTLPISVARARLFVTETLWEWGMRGLCDTADVVVSELVTNAIRASAWLYPLVTVVLWADRVNLLIEVCDNAPGVPVPTVSPDESGRGLHLVCALSDNWGYYLNSCGKTVWAYLRA
jgi:anti-sigma regulatory factor (Ser/Thr protein kinase)